jgi:hypothetical protein
MDTGITAVTGTITVGGEGTATIMVGGTIIIDRDLTLKRPPRLAASIIKAGARDVRLVASSRYGGLIGNVRSRGQSGRSGNASRRLEMDLKRTLRSAHNDDQITCRRASSRVAQSVLRSSLHNSRRNPFQSAHLSRYHRVS